MAKKHDIFVSYSTVHADLVGPLVQLLRVSGRLIFHDKTSIEPGDDWHDKIMDSLDQAKTVVIIWCSHASKSEWVKKEWDAAIEKKKKIVPVLLDQTKLPDAMRKYQWIDMNALFSHSRVNVSYSEPEAEPTKELPFVVGVMADLAANVLPRDERFVKIDKYEFVKCLGELCPPKVSQTSPEDSNSKTEGKEANEASDTPKIQVDEIRTGFYRAIACLRPHFQLSEPNVNLELVTDLPDIADNCTRVDIQPSASELLINQVMDEIARIEKIEEDEMGSMKGTF